MLYMRFVVDCIDDNTLEINFCIEIVAIFNVIWYNAVQSSAKHRRAI